MITIKKAEENGRLEESMVDVLERIDVEERIVGLLFEIISYLDAGNVCYCMCVD